MKKKLISIFFIIMIVILGDINTCFADGTLTVDGIMKGAEDFISEGQSSSIIDDKALKSTSNFLYNLLLGIGIIVAVVVGVILGIKYMIGSVDEKAELKETLWAYLISCFVVFGAFGIWKIVVKILQAM